MYIDRWEEIEERFYSNGIFAALAEGAQESVWFDDEVVVGALFDDAAVVQDDKSIAEFHDVFLMGDDDGSLSSLDLDDSFEDFLLVDRVQGGGAFVEDQDGPVLVQEGAGDGETLGLAGGDELGVLPDLGLQLVGESLHELAQLNLLYHRLHLRLDHVLLHALRRPLVVPHHPWQVSIGDVLKHRPVE